MPSLRLLRRLALLGIVLCAISVEAIAVKGLPTCGQTCTTNADCDAGGYCSSCQTSVNNTKVCMSFSSYSSQTYGTYNVPPGGTYGVTFAFDEHHQGFFQISVQPATPFVTTPPIYSFGSINILKQSSNDSLASPVLVFTNLAGVGYNTTEEVTIIIDGSSLNNNITVVIVAAYTERWYVGPSLWPSPSGSSWAQDSNSNELWTFQLDDGKGIYSETAPFQISVVQSGSCVFVATLSWVDDYKGHSGSQGTILPNYVSTSNMTLYGGSFTESGWMLIVYVVSGLYCYLSVDAYSSPLVNFGSTYPFSQNVTNSYVACSPDQQTQCSGFSITGTAGSKGQNYCVNVQMDASSAGCQANANGSPGSVVISNGELRVDVFVPGGVQSNAVCSGTVTVSAGVCSEKAANAQAVLVH